MFSFSLKRKDVFPQTFNAGFEEKTLRCGQAVRHRVLVSAFPGSNPGTSDNLTKQEFSNRRLSCNNTGWRERGPHGV